MWTNILNYSIQLQFFLYISEFVKLNKTKNIILPSFFFLFFNFLIFFFTLNVYLLHRTGQLVREELGGMSTLTRVSGNFAVALGPVVCVTRTAFVWDGIRVVRFGHCLVMDALLFHAYITYEANIAITKIKVKISIWIDNCTLV